MLRGGQPSARKELRNNEISDNPPQAPFLRTPAACYSEDALDTSRHIRNPVTFTSQIRKSSVRLFSRVHEDSKTQDVISLWESHFTESVCPTLIYTSHEIIIIAIIWDLRSFLRLRSDGKWRLRSYLCGFSCLYAGAEGTLPNVSQRDAFDNLAV